MNSRVGQMGAGRRSIIGVGLLVADVLVQDGVSKRRQYVRAGGTCGNVLTILGALGWNSKPIARLGCDPAAEVIKEDMRFWGVDLSLIEVVAAKRSPVFLHRLFESESGTPGHRFTRQCPDCGKWFPGFQPVPARSISGLLDCIGGADVLFVDRVSRGAIELARHLSEEGALVVFEPSSASDSRQFAEMATIAHVVKYSSERAHKVSNILQDITLNCLVIETLGADGLRYQRVDSNSLRDEWAYRQPSSPTHIRDTAGSGDWCSAGMLHYWSRAVEGGLTLLESDVIEEGLKWGQELAAWNCAFEGARGGMYRWPAIELSASLTAFLGGPWASRNPTAGLESMSSWSELSLCSFCSMGSEVLETRNHASVT